jgi:hypothetical protein
MTDDDGKREGPGRSFAKDSRQDRLKLALRENLKRRKSQARQRGGEDASSLEAETTLDEPANGGPDA